MRVIELHGRHAEVEEHTVHERMPDVRQHVGQPVVAGVHQVQPGLEPEQSFPAARQRHRVAVQSDHRQLGMGRQERLSVSAETDGRVDHHRRMIGEGGREQPEDPIEQYRDMTDSLPGSTDARSRWTALVVRPSAWVVPGLVSEFNASATSPVGADAGRRLGSPPVVRATCLGPGKLPQGRDGRDGGRPERTS